MSVLKEMIRRQAEAVKGNSNEAKVLEYLKKAAELMAQEKPKAAFSLDGNKNHRGMQRQRFADAISTNKNSANQKQLLDGAQKDLAAAGWKPAQSAAAAPGTLPAYVHPSLPGYQLGIDGDSFTIKNGTDVMVGKSPLSKLKKVLAAVDPAGNLPAPAPTKPITA